MTSLIILAWKVTAFAAAAGLLGVAALTFVPETGAESVEVGQSGHTGAATTARVIAAPDEITARYPFPVLSMMVTDD